jgi:hypothetical protein
MVSNFCFGIVSGKNSLRPPNVALAALAAFNFRDVASSPD